MKNLLRYTIYLFYFGGILSLVLAYLAAYINPLHFSLPAFFGIAYPFILIYNLAFLLFWMARKKWKLLIFTILIILAGWPNLTRMVQLRFGTKPDSTEGIIKVLSYNVRNFDLYNWTNNEATRDEIFKMIDKEDADIICFQEFYKDDGTFFNTFDSLLTFQKAKNYHESYSSIVLNIHHFGIATFSKYPIINKGELSIKNIENKNIYTDILVNKDTVRIYNCHLESIRFKAENYIFVDSLKFKFDNEQIEGARNILVKLRDAFYKRAVQVDYIADHIAASPYPTIVCGDFNDTPFSYTYETIRNGLRDSFVEAGGGFGKSYSGKFPSFRIDYILYSDYFSCMGYETGIDSLSDHSPIISWLKVKE